jgi:hypothetical protein
MTLFAVRTRDDLLAVRFACSPVWETQAAVQAFADGRALADHEPWQRLVHERVARLDLTPLLALLPNQGYVPDFLTPPPRSARPRLRDQLAEIRATPPAQVARELERCRESAADGWDRRLLDALPADPAQARDLLAARLHEAWVGGAVLGAHPDAARARHRAALACACSARSPPRPRRAPPAIRWTKRGLSCADRSARTVEVDERGLVLMPSVYLWPNVAAIIDKPWLPTIVYPARGISELWRARAAPPDALARLLGRTRALVLASLDRPLSTTALAALLELSPRRRLTPPARPPRCGIRRQRTAQPRGSLRSNRVGIRRATRRTSVKLRPH